MYIDLVTINLCPGQGGGGVKPSGTLDIVENGVYNVYSYSSASVDVHPSISLSETYISNGSYNITGEFKDGVITVDVPAPQFITETLNVSSNGTYTPGQGVDGYSQVVVDVPAPQFVTETLNVSDNGTYTPGEGIDGYSKVVVDVPQSVTGFTQKEMTEGTVKIINLDNSASFVSYNAFNNNKTIQTVNLPNCTSVGENAFYSCHQLSQVSLPVCGSIMLAAFFDCSKLTQVYLPMCSYISNFAFNKCSSLSQVSLPVCSYIGGHAFQYCNKLTQVYLPMCSTFYAYTFNDCSSLSQVSLPVCGSIGDNVFRGCHKLTQVYLPMCSYISNNVFAYCSSLSIITIGYSSVCILTNSNTFYETKITSSTGSIYVPTSLVDAYKSATNWSYFSTQIFPIE